MPPAIPELAGVPALGLEESFKNLRLALYDEREGRMLAVDPRAWGRR